MQHNNDAKYVIVSNFNELRFYFDKATAYERFFLFDLDYEGFKKLHTILSYESISKELPHAIREKSLTFEQDISNQLYKDYTAFRSHLFENILANNPHADKLELLNATQKLIDRIVFILFGEDTDLLPKHTIPTIIQKQKEVKKLVKNFTLYDSYKVYFEAINSGDADLDITMYNGGLFAQDAFLDALVIEDKALDARAKILSAYNFGSDISVNILGHIFENSISELEEMSAKLQENDFDKKQSKRKKDGVFYTPAYITEYIVQNTLGKLCEEKREALKIIEVQAINNPKKPTKKEQEIKENLLLYKEWLLNLKILDPACGSGAFLNQALEYLLKEHKKLQNDLSLMGDLFAVYEVEKEVLEHNLYGVDINEGAVEIARLSLWLRTAKRGRPLTKLANKIKVGNSLIDDKTIVPNAFDWHKEFPEVFAQGGFDVVIGNPPYVGLSKLKDIDYSKYEVYEKTGDILALFIEKSIQLCKTNALMSFIVSNSWLKTKYGESLKKYLEANGQTKVVNFVGTQLFADATVESCIVAHTKNSILANKEKQSISIENIRNFNAKTASIETLYNTLQSNIEDDKESLLMKKVERVGVLLKEWDIKINYGIKTGFNEAFIIDGTKKDELLAKDQKSSEIIKPLLRGRDIQKYELIFDDKWLINSHNNPPVNIDDYLVIKEHLHSYYEKLEKRLDKGKTPYNLRNCAYIEDFFKPKIVWGEISDKPKFAYDNGDYFIEATSFIMTGESLKYILAFLNSRLSKWYFERISTTTGVGTSRWKKFKLELLPIVKIPDDKQQPFIECVDEIMELNKNLQETKQNFTNELKLEKLTKKLQNFEELSFEEFITEYTKALKLKFADKLAERNFKQEWQAIFENDKTLASGYKTEIEKTDKEIDKMVYELYGLSDEEIKIIEDR